MENKKKSFPKALIIVISVVSLIAMFTLSAFATTTSIDVDAYDFYFNTGSNIVSFNDGDTTYDMSDYDWVGFGNSISAGTGTYPTGSTTIISRPVPVDNITLYISGTSVVLYNNTQATSQTFNVGDIINVTDEGAHLYYINIEQYTEPSLWDGVTGAVPTLLTNIGSTATAIVNNEYLALFCLVLPLISLAVGLLIRMRDRT